MNKSRENSVIGREKRIWVQDFPKDWIQSKGIWWTCWDRSDEEPLFQETIFRYGEMTSMIAWWLWRVIMTFRILCTVELCYKILGESVDFSMLDPRYFIFNPYNTVVHHTGSCIGVYYCCVCIITKSIILTFCCIVFVLFDSLVDDWWNK